jgi:hypothetical protein
MKIYSKLPDLKEAPYPVYSWVKKILLREGQTYEELKEHTASMGIPEDEIFLWAMGGYVCQLETVEDLGYVQTNIPSEDEMSWLSLQETAGHFDAIDILEDDWICIFIATNNSGGPLFFIPGWMRLHCSYIEKSIENAREDNLLNTSKPEGLPYEDNP